MLITDLVKSKLPALYSTEDDKDPVAFLKFFNPVGRGTWYLIEYDPEERLAFGYVDLGSPELGYFSMAELEEMILPMGLKIERDFGFIPTKLSEIKKQMEAVT